MNHSYTQSSLEPSERLLRANWNFIQAIQKGGIGALIDTVGEFFHCPVILVDKDFRLLAWHSGNISENHFYQHLVQNRCLDVNIMLKILQENVSNVHNFYEPFYANSGTCRETPIIMGELVRQNTVYGHLIVCLGDNHLQSDDLLLVKQLLSLIDMTLYQKEDNMDHWNKAMATRLQDLLILDTPQHLIDLAVLRLQQTYQNIVSMIYENSIVTLFGGVKYSKEHPILKPDNNYLAGKLFQYFKRYNMKSGLSNSFSDLRFTRLFYHQALYAAELSVEKNQTAPAVFMEQMPLPLFFSLLKIEPGMYFFILLYFKSAVMIKNMERNTKKRCGSMNFPCKIKMKPLCG